MHRCTYAPKQTEESRNTARLAVHRSAVIKISQRGDGLCWASLRLPLRSTWSPVEEQRTLEHPVKEGLVILAAELQVSLGAQGSRCPGMTGQLFRDTQCWRDTEGLEWEWGGTERLCGAEESAVRLQELLWVSVFIYKDNHLFSSEYWVAWLPPI